MRYYGSDRKDDRKSRFVRNLDWNLLKVFAEIAGSGGVSRAAGAMSRQQPTVSSALKRLEDFLGVVLCQRGPTGFELTQQGHYVWEICREFITELEEIPSQLRQMDNANFLHLRLVSVGDIVCPALDSALASFCRAYPHCEVLIDVVPPACLEDMVVDRSADIGIGPIKSKNEKLSYSLLYREQNVPLCGRRHPLFGRTVSDPAVLAKEQFILLGEMEAEPVRQFRNMHGWGKSCVGLSLDPNEVKRMVLLGAAIAILPREFLELDIASGNLWQLMPPPPEAQVDIFAISLPAPMQSLSAGVFLDFVWKHANSEAAEVLVAT